MFKNLGVFAGPGSKWAGFTFSDGRIVTYDKNNSMPIYNLTTQQCLSLEYNEQYDGKYCKVTDFETFIRICSESNKWAFITVRDEHVDEVVAAVMPILEKYNWVGSSVINSFTLYTLEAFRKASPDIKLSYVLQYGKILTRMDVDTAVRLGNCMVCAFLFRVSDMETGWSKLEECADGLAYAMTKGLLTQRRLSSAQHHRPINGIYGGEIENVS